VLRIEPLKPDQAPSAILELVDGPKDMRFAMTARTIARERGEGRELGEMTTRNIEKVTRYRLDGESELEKMVGKISGLEIGERNDVVSDEKRWGGKV
jgi:large subunit ribosomal protein L17